MDRRSWRQKLSAPSDVASDNSAHVPLDTSSSKYRFSCEQCERSFVQKSSLGRHIRESHETIGASTRFRCDLCEKEFQRPEGIRNHILKDRCAFRRKSLAPGDASPNGISLFDFLWMCALSDGSSLDDYVYATSQPYSSGSCTGSRLQILVGISARRLLMDLAEFDDSPGGPGRPLSITHSILNIRKLYSSVDDLERLKVLLGVLRHFNRCKLLREPYRGPFPPAFDLPTPQDLENLLGQESRERCRIRMVESFQSTHRRFGESHGAPEDMELVPLGTAQRKRLVRHRTVLKQAWQDGMDAAFGILSGSLPRELHSVLGVAEVASGIRVAVDDIDSPIASEGKFLSDLSRWRQILPDDCHPAFDYYADLLWDHRPPLDSAWSKPPDAETLVYFQDLLAELLSYVELSVAQKTPCDATVSTSDLDLGLVAITTSFCSALDEFESAESEYVGAEEQFEAVPATFTEVVLYSAGAIFGLIIVFLLRKPFIVSSPAYPANPTVQFT